MIVILLFAIAWFVVVPAGITIGGLVSGVLATVALGVALVAGGPVVGVAAASTGSRHRLARLAGWGGVGLAGTVAVGAGAAAGVFLALMVAARAALPLVGY